MSYKSINKTPKKKGLFFENSLASLELQVILDLQIKESLQNKTTDYNNYTRIKTILSTQMYLFVTNTKKTLIESYKS